MRHTRNPPGPSGTTAEFYQPTMFSPTPPSGPNYGNPFPTGNMGPSGFFSPQTAFYAPTNPTMNNAIPGMEFLSNNPLLNVGFNAVEQGVKDFTNRTVKTSLSSIKYYFAVDQSYVVKKLFLLFFSFRPRNWSLRYSDDQPAPPRVDTNAPDFYIPLMSAITYVLVAGLVLGLQNKFSPEQLGIHASSTLIWNIIEISILSFIFYVLNVRTKLRTLDLVAYCGYKYVVMIAILCTYLLTQSLMIYRCSLIYFSLSLSYFLVKSLRLQILPGIQDSDGFQNAGHKRRIYLLLLIVVIQPLFIWYLTQHLILI